MKSLWRELVYVHAHQLWREDLMWRDQIDGGLDRPKLPASSRCVRADRADHADHAERTGSTGPKARDADAAQWPRLSAPR